MRCPPKTPIERSNTFGFVGEPWPQDNTHSLGSLLVQWLRTFELKNHIDGAYPLSKALGVLNITNLVRYIGGLSSPSSSADGVKMRDV